VGLANQRTQPDGDILFQAAGWVEPDPFAVNASVLIPGVVEKINVLEGHTVSKGDELALLIPDDARLDVMRAKAHLAFKRAKKTTGIGVDGAAPCRARCHGRPAQST
jgi:multidrug efflux pump subunit AcrA (membrane-fusion protein)